MNTSILAASGQAEKDSSLISEKETRRASDGRRGVERDVVEVDAGAAVDVLTGAAG